jgi:hypothetical protein
MSSRLAVDGYGRLIVEGTCLELRGLRWLVIDGRELGLLPTQARPPDARERMQTAKTFYDSNSGKRARAERLDVPDDELDERAALEAARLEQQRTPPDLLNVAA